jgi:two-component system sensor histidine kinase UhpB
MDTPRLPLLWRIFALNAAIFIVIAILLIVSPVTISAPIELSEVLIVLVGLILTLLADFVLLWRAIAPLRRLAERMELVDLLQPGQQRLPVGPGTVGRVVQAYNEMLGRLEEERRRSAGRALAAQEAERIGIARNLHDEVGQLLTGVLLQLDSLAEAVPDRRADVTDTKRVVRKALDEVRRISAELRPEMLEHLGLVSALTELTTSFSRRSGIRVERRYPPDLPALTPEAELVIYRIAQEALTNVARHSDASLVTMSLECEPEKIVLRIVDDGLGFPGGSVPEGHGGLRSMRERAVLIDGSLVIWPGTAGGVGLRLEVPIMVEAPVAPFVPVPRVEAR